MIDDFLGELSTVDVSDSDLSRYNATIALGQWLSAFPRVDGYMYPSVATKLSGVNLVMPTGSADRHFKPKLCYVFEAEKSNAPWYNVAARLIASSTAIREDGTIEWEQYERQPLSTLGEPPRLAPWRFD